MSFMIVVHDWLWEIYWIIWTFLWSIIWPIIQILLFIPELIIEFWYYLMNLIFPTLDGICVDILLWLEENLVDPILEALQQPEWTPSWFELPAAMPMIVAEVMGV